MFYGDASRLDLLYAAGAGQAKLLVLAIDDHEKIEQIVNLAHKHFPHLRLLVRAGDRRHAYSVIRQGIDVITRATFSSALDMGVEALKLLGVRSYRAVRAAQMFKAHNEEALQEQAMLVGNEKALPARSRQLSEDLEQLL